MKNVCIIVLYVFLVIPIVSVLFNFSSASFDPGRRLCHFSDWNLDTSLREELLVTAPGAVYLEPACQLGADTCGITEVSGRIAKTVDSVFEGVFTRTQCKELCKKSSFR